jgi:hypothetical protein
MHKEKKRKERKRFQSCAVEDAASLLARPPPHVTTHVAPHFNRRHDYYLFHFKEKK